MDKSSCQKIHAKRKAFQRYGVTLNRIDYRNLVHKIQEGKAIRLYRQSNRVTIWKVDFNGTSMIAVYDSARKTICSFLSPDMDFIHRPSALSYLSDSEYEQFIEEES